MAAFAWIGVAALAACAGIWLRRRSRRRSNFFASASQFPDEPASPERNDDAERNRVLKRRFRKDAVPEGLDAIVVGSGVGGLVCAGLMARAGKRVLVLERHDRVGGCTHTYTAGGYEFDVGVHIVGDMARNSESSAHRLLVDFVTDNRLEWAAMDREYDVVVIDRGGEAADVERFAYRTGLENARAQLLRYFPGERKAVNAYFDAIKINSRMATFLFTLLKLIPLPALKWLVFLRLDHLLLRTYRRVALPTLAETLDELTDNAKLKTVLAYIFGTYGTEPDRVSFFVHMLLANHFLAEGGFYPVGGSSEIAYRMVPGIEASGGAVLAGAVVQEIVFDDRGKARGVKLKNYRGLEIRAPVVISDAGLHNTLYSLLPSDQRDKDREYVERLGSALEPAVSGFQVLVGLNGSGEELGLEAKNYFVCQSDDLLQRSRDWLSFSCEEAVNSSIPCPVLFISFPSAKDPSWSERHPGKSTCAILGMARVEWFAEWEHEPCQKRGRVYQSLKSAFVDQMWRQVARMFPRVADRAELIEGGTPLSYKHFINSAHGELFGANHNVERFSVENAMRFRPGTPWSGVYLTGQDVFTVGFMGAAVGGLLTASVVLKRQLMKELMEQAAVMRTSARE